MRINVAVPEQAVDAPVLNAALEAVTRLNQKLIRSGASPTSDQLIDAGARWRPEPPGQEHFDHGGILAGRGHGDCDDWAPLHAATLRETGEDPRARAVVRKSGHKRWHALVQRSDGSFDDPSIEAGMPTRGQRVPGVNGSWVPVMPHARSAHSSVVGEVGSYIAMPRLALRPITDRSGQIEAWQSRTDLPWHWLPGKSPTDVAMASLHASPVSDQAVVGSVLGAYRLGCVNGAEPEQLKRLLAIADACEGCPWEELAARYGQEHANAAGHVVGSFFGKLLRKVGKVAKGIAKPLASTALSFVPGGNLAKAAFSMASPLLKRHVKHGRHKPPQQRSAPSRRVAMPSRRVVVPSRPSAPRGPQFLPYPYPLPYPIPMGASWSGAAPGTAWPPRAR